MYGLDYCNDFLNQKFDISLTYVVCDVKHEDMSTYKIFSNGCSSRHGSNVRGDSVFDRILEYMVSHDAR